MKNKHPLRTHFITGLVTLLPLVLTAVIVLFLMNMITKPFIGLVESLLEYYRITIPPFLIFNGQEVLRFLCQVFVLLGLILITTMIGLAANSFVFHQFVSLWEGIILKTPFIGKIYHAAREVMHTLFRTSKQNFGTVVLVPFPHKKNLSIGLITNDALKDGDQETNEDLISVFIPTTPNPTMGFLLMYKREDILFTDMKVEKALKSVISCGLLMPPFEITGHGSN
ncbi:MAG: DUF502 domain-containing protein [Chlamydiales bacterium]